MARHLHRLRLNDRFLLDQNQHNGTFREEGLMRGVALSDDEMKRAGMGVGVGDYDLDGRRSFQDPLY